MSAIRDNITETIKQYMKSHDLERVKLLRNVQAVIKQIEIDRRVTLDDVGILEILQKQIK